MNTPPPESEFPKPEPFPSVSTPVPQLPLTDSSPPPPTSGRRRRHTMVTQADAAVELLSDGDDNEHDDHALDRISGILSTLLQEANDAIQSNHSNNIARSYSPRKPNVQPPRPRPHSALLRSSTSTHYNTSSRPKSILSLSRLPRPTRSTQYRRTHDRHSSISSSASSVSLFSPVPTTAESPTTASSVEQSSNYFLDHPKDSNLHHRDDIIIASSPTDLIQPLSSFNHSDDEDGTEMMDETRQTHDDHGISPIDAPPSSATTQYTLPRFDGPLMESFRRLDSSMAMVESLSRDLAQQHDEMAHQGHPRLDTFLSSTSTTSKLALLFLPLLHIPHALITTVFDTLISSPGNTTWSTSSSSFVNASSSFSGIVAWTLCFALANIVVTWSGAPSRCLTPRRSSADIVRPRRLSLPGSYQPNNNNNNIWSFEANHGMERSKRPTPINTTLCHRKQPASYSVRRTPIKRSTPSSARKRLFRPSPTSASMAVTQSNDRSYALAIQQSRAWKKQQLGQQIADGWEWVSGDHQQQHQQLLTRRRYSF